MVPMPSLSWRHALAVWLLLAVSTRAGLLRDNVASFTPHPLDSTNYRLSTVPAQGTAFSSARRAEVFVKPTNPWDIQLISPTLEPVAQNDVIAGELWFRNAAPDRGGAVLEIVFELASEPWTPQSHVQTVNEYRGEWTRVRFAFTSQGTYAPGQAQGNLRLGGAVQAVDIGPFAMTNYARTRALAEFPKDTVALGDLVGGPPLVPRITDLTPLLGSDATETIFPITGQPYAVARRIQTLRQPSDSYSIQLHGPTSASVAQGDILSGEIWLRKSGSAALPAVTEIIFERNGKPHTKSLQRIVTEGNGRWERHRFAFASAESYAPGEAALNLRLGHRVQTLDLAGLVLTNHGRSRPLAQFPNDVTYDERASDSPWRQEADRRIDQHRKATMTVQVRDASGRPVPGASVAARQTRHAFPFGSAVPADLLLQSGADADRFRRIVTNWFTRCVLENDLKWPEWEANRKRALDGVRWLRSRGLEVRGHNLIWPSRAYLPADVAGLLSQPAALRRRIDGHFSDVLGALAGQCVDWDVINEPYTNHDVQDVLGQGELLSWLQLARRLDPKARLYLNDFENLEALPGSAHAEAYYQLARSLVAQGAPLDGIGLQSHVAAYLASPSEVYQTLDRFASLVPEVSITELDVVCPDPAIQADYLRDFTLTAFSHPKTRAILLWGFWEGRMWNASSALFRRDWNLTPNGTAWSNLVFRTWWTTTNLVTDASGRATFRGFKGDYQLEIRSASATQLLTTRLETDASVVVDPPGNPNPPRLTWGVSSGRPFLAWPEDHLGFRVEFAPALPATVWSPIPSTPARVDGTWRVDLGPQPGFYRVAR